MSTNLKKPDARIDFPATSRNREPILELFKRILPSYGTILEIASGSGQHITYFAKNIDALTWQPSDADPNILPSIAAWTKSQNLEEKILPPLLIDTRMPNWHIKDSETLSAIIIINLVHIAPWNVITSLFKQAENLLKSDSLLYFYGPYKINNLHTSTSNEKFDQALKCQNIEWGVRNLDDLITLATFHNFRLMETVPMPANNRSVIFKKNIS